MKRLIILLLALFNSALIHAQTMEELEDPKLKEAIDRVKRLKQELKAANEDVRRISEEGSGKKHSEIAIDKVAAALATGKKQTAELSQNISENPASALRIRQSVKDPTKAALPAMLQLTRTKTGKDSKLVDLGIAYEQDFDTSANEPNASWSLLGEYHHLTQSKALPNGVDTLLLGGSLDWYPATGENEPGQDIRATLAYKRDRIVSGEGLISDVSWYPNFPGCSIGDANFGNAETHGLMEANLRPYVGLQFEEGNGATGFRDGDRVSLRAGLSLNVTLLPVYLGNRLTWENKLSFWDHLDTSGVYSTYDSGQWYLSSKLTYWFYTPKKGNASDILTQDEQHLGLSFGYNWGDNPEEGKLNTDMATFGLAVKY
ncbi:MAG: hypothetical protein QM755_22420 [Luteolibacter sp.]